MEEKKIKALYIDDSIAMASIYKEQLREDGIEIEHASDGVQAFEKLKTYKPDIILLDIIMPNMDGFEFLEKIKQQKDLSNIPVVLLTSLDQEKIVEDLKSKGAAGYFVKADNFQRNLSAKIMEVLKR